MILLHPVAGIGAAVVAAVGVHLMVTAIVHGWSGLGVGPQESRLLGRRAQLRWRRAVLDRTRRPVRAMQLAAAMALGALGWIIFGSWSATLLASGVGCAVPPALARQQRAARAAAALDAWPRMIEEIRLSAVTLGRSVPQALFDAGFRAPAELHPAFNAAHREWTLSGDFGVALEVLCEHLADATADAVAETLLIADQIGGSEIDQHLQSLADDRAQDLQGRKDAMAKQAGVRFARWFVVIVPIGMALVGLSIGDGRTAYATMSGQIAVTTALSLIAACWWWAGRLMRLPAEPRVLRPACPRNVAAEHR